MHYILKPYSKVFEPYCWWENAFSEQELNWIQKQAINSQEAALVGAGEEIKNIRRSKVSWIENTEKTVWIFEKLAHVVSSLNSQFYNFDLTGFGEPLQLTNYDVSESGMYGWHQDFGAMSISRKLSLVLQLTDPSNYEGGNLQIMTSGQPQNMKKQRGLIVVFPSFQLHQVTPVTQGSRQSLVAWISGPAFK